jgi:hypothetical protein
MVSSTVGSSGTREALARRPALAAAVQLRPHVGPEAGGAVEPAQPVGVEGIEQVGLGAHEADHVQVESLGCAVLAEPSQGLGIADQGHEVLGAEQQIAAPAPLLVEQPLQRLEAAGLQGPGQIAVRPLPPGGGVAQTRPLQARPVGVQPGLQVGAGGLVGPGVQVQGALGWPQRSRTHGHCNGPAQGMIAQQQVRFAPGAAA